MAVVAFFFHLLTSVSMIRVCFMSNLILLWYLFCLKCFFLFYYSFKKYSAVIRNNPMIPIDTSPLQFLICNISSSSLLPLYLFLHIEKYIIAVIINRTITIIKTIFMLSLLL